MKIKTMVLLGIGYAIGSRLGPQQLENAARAALESDPTRPVLPAARSVEASLSSAWPDADFSS